MKIPLKNRAVSLMPENPRDLFPWEEIKVFDYAHDEPLLGEIAGHVFNRYLKFRKERSLDGHRFSFRLGSDNPTKANLHIDVFVDNEAVAKSQARVMENVYEQACEELLYKAFEAIDILHKRDNNFFDRIKYVFKK